MTLYFRDCELVLSVHEQVDDTAQTKHQSSFRDLCVIAYTEVKKMITKLWIAHMDTQIRQNIGINRIFHEIAVKTVTFLSVMVLYDIWSK